MATYDHKKIEKKWQERWAADGIYRAVESDGKPKFYILDMFPYPSGDGLHVGHPKGYIATDIYARYKRMLGHNVLHPMGWDAFGLPAENFALKNKVHPRVAVEKNIATFKSQLAKIGFDYDWSREVNTTDPAFYKWTQWIFLQLFKRGLAYQSDEPINWCPSCKTGLANEDLESDGTCERCGTLVEKKRLPQWVLKITDYADRLLEDLAELDGWPEHIKESQRNWIGRSEGAEIDFPIAGHSEVIRVFTTRPDTVFGATYMVLAPEHPLVEALQDSFENYDEVVRYIELAGKKTEIERTAEGKEKTGIELKGMRALNPATNEEIPVFIADYVLADYGTGAIMAVPAHDERDYAFAKKYQLPIKQVVAMECGVPNDAADERQGGVAIIYNPKINKLAVIQHPEAGLRLYGGGVETSEEIQAGILREVEEESGFHNFLQVEELFTCWTNYYNSVKKLYRKGRGTCLLLILKDTDQLPLKLEDHESEFKLAWVTPEELRKDWIPRNNDRGRDHWLTFLDLAEQRLAELGYPLAPTFSASRIFTGPGVLVDSGKFSGMRSDEAKQAIVEFVGGTMTTTYKLRDWVLSRQRYWGEPIPIIHCEKCGAVPVPEEDLPVLLPDVEHYEPSGTGESPLALITEWVNTPCPSCGGLGRRETNTMPQWAGSSWYWLRFMDPTNESALVSKKHEKYWAPVDVYVGGAEHATRHLIYARFWHKFLFDIGIVSTKEPFSSLHSVGLIIAEDGKKMSKRFGNVINPDDIVERFGADTLRVYEMFMGPFENAIAWSTDNLIGARRFVERVWKLSQSTVEDDVEAIENILHQTVKKVGDDIEAFKFNTAVSQMMIFLNKAEEVGTIGQSQWERFLQILAPFAPHMTEELWYGSEQETSIHVSRWPAYDESKLVEDSVTIVVQVNGKVRGNFVASREDSEEDLAKTAQRLPEVERWTQRNEPKKVIVVPGKLVNIVV